ncbi:D-xylose ABC transporter substrate-binding protein [Cohnella faecalis]|uniref:D-xylose ABC transporter substrate-binding protein n=1 Tax=Cohnella faecalis TaxID=2315694 RepID=UPI0036238A23
MRTVSKKALILSLAAMLVILPACSSNNGGQQESSSEAAASGDEKIVVGFLMDTLEEERWQRDKQYMTAEAEANNVEIKIQVANGDDAKQISQAENLINQGIDVLVAVPHNAEAASAIVEIAHDANIPVLSYERLIKNADVDFYIQVDGERVGEIQAEALTKLVPKGNYVLIEGADTDNSAHLFKQGQMNILKPFVDKGDIKIVYDQWTEEWDPANALANMENALTSNNNKVDAVLAANDGTAGGAIQALEAQGLAGKVPVTGQDAELAAMKRIIEGTQTMTVYKPIQPLAKKAMEVAIQMAKKETVKTDSVTNNGKNDVPTVLVEPIAITKDNIDKEIIESGFYTKEQVYGK